MNLCIFCSSKDLVTKSYQKLNFKNCYVIDERYKKIKINAPIYREKNLDINDHGFCEYRLCYGDSVILYVSTQIDVGSSLNFKNRVEDGIESYSFSKYMDTIKVEGKQDVNRYWLEHILGDVVVGYVNVPESRKKEFDQAVKSVVRVK